MLWENLVMGTLMVLFLVWCLASVLFGVWVWPSIAEHIHRMNGLDKKE